MWVLVIFLYFSYFTSSAKGLEPSGYLTVNSKNYSSPETLELARSSKPETQDYYFYDGEPANFTCYKAAGDLVQLSYVKDEKSLSTGFQSVSSVEFYIKLKANFSNDSYMTCSFTTNGCQPVSFIQVNLILKNRSEKEVPGFEVSGLILPRIKSIEHDYYYEYKYYRGETVTIRIVKDGDLGGDVSCRAEGTKGPDTMERYCRDNVNQEKALTINLYPEHTGASLRCNIHHLADQKQNVNITITFIFLPPDFSKGSYIGHLSMAHTLIKYADTTANNIQYEYIGNEQLSLTCSPNGSWSYTIPHLITTFMNDTKKMIKYLKYFKLQPNITSTDIKCNKNSSNYSIVKLIRVKKYEYEIFDNPEQSTDKGDNVVILTIVIMAAIVVIIAVSWIVVHYVLNSRKKHKENLEPNNSDQNMHYPNQNIPMSDQQSSQSDVTYAAPENLELIYSKPVPKTLRPRPDDPTYSQVHDTLPEPTYASPLQENLVYSEVVYQNKHPNGALAKVDNLTYAEIVFDSRGDGIQSSSLRDDAKVVQVESMERHYACIKINDFKE